ncbi:scarecrow-like protein 3 [Physcomitrium patens]|uniref:Uncharacterized protein n=1 Tax=Physcomitrium patens TaxID=3218 RepID=A0A2K1JV70_PHYPA|nr:scarecrow-like protein 3 [Physcomitrium patens]XP_024389854.1 scarecrow-like protein 3 [Physcomitrium patens]XP_024389855.1 scarecrow-like protein 3 [Physcomitrium patens]XP_024389856.1 scarecrow-like protein 3 [Physcomitrium patens]XP_024389857.1 scarecrow-like protein 3 [Physcomitrium patens]PNR45415.1 hypothetical protein PHYPA_015186 [Physcomitrium patens]|eukprot:XP_024389853.1 scarecrow-like protein 3 [Physcomitrella patens]
MPGMIKGETSNSISHSPSLSVSTTSFSSLSHVSAHQSSSSSTSTPAQLTWLQELRSEERGLYLIHLLLACANAVANNNMEYTNVYLEQLSVLASLTGDPMQRVATYFMEGLAARITKSWPGLHKALHSTHLPFVMDIISARQLFFSVCPYVKFAFLMGNQAILDAMEGEMVVHIVDLEASDPVQWLALLQELSNRQAGPPHLRITGVSLKRDVLEQTGQRLSEEAEKLDIPFQFHPLVASLENLDVDSLKVKSGEAVAISSMMRLHPLLAKESDTVIRTDTDYHSHPEIHHFRSSSGGYEKITSAGRDEAINSTGEIGPERGLKRSRETYEAAAEVAGENLKVPVDGSEAVDRQRTRSTSQSDGNGSCVEPRGNSVPRPLRDESSFSDSGFGSGVVQRVLQKLQSLSPKVMVLVEQDSNHNSGSMPDRFVEALHYYSAMFDSLDLTLPQHCLERVTLEKFLLGQEIKNIVACEGAERVERHEKLDRWRIRMRSAGFVARPLSSTAALQAKRLLHGYPCDGYRVKDDQGCLTLCWQDTPLYTASAWTV